MACRLFHVGPAQFHVLFLPNNPQPLAVENFSLLSCVREHLAGGGGGVKKGRVVEVELELSCKVPALFGPSAVQLCSRKSKQINKYCTTYLHPL